MKIWLFYIILFYKAQATKRTMHVRFYSHEKNCVLIAAQFEQYRKHNQSEINMHFCGIAIKALQTSTNICVYHTVSPYSFSLTFCQYPVLKSSRLATFYVHCRYTYFIFPQKLILPIQIISNECCLAILHMPTIFSFQFRFLIVIINFSLYFVIVLSKSLSIFYLLF